MIPIQHTEVQSKKLTVSIDTLHEGNGVVAPEVVV